MPETKLKYSHQARALIGLLKEFDQADFEKWYSENLLIGSKTVLEYIAEKQKRDKALTSKEAARA